MRKAKQSTAKNVMILMVDSTDHVTGKTGLTLTITASKDGAAFASISPTVTERGNGWYNIALTSSHTDTLGDLALHITGTAADPADIVLLVEAGATDADVSTRLATAGYTAPDNATITTIQSDTNDIQARLPAALVSGRIDASVGAMAADVVTASAIAAGAITATEAPALANLDAAVSTRLSTAGYTAPDNASVAAILVDTAEIGVAGAGLTALATQASVNAINDFLDTEVGDIKAKTDQLTFTVAGQVDANALTGGGGLDAAGVRAAVGLAAANLDTQLGAIDDFLDTEVAGIKAKTDLIPADPADQSAVEAAITAATAPLATAADLAVVDAVVDAILVDTAEIGAAGAGLTALATQASVNTIDDFLDTEVAAIKAKTDQLTFTVANQVDSNALTGGGGLDAAGVRAAVGLASANLDTQLGTIDDFLDTEVAAIKAKTDLIPAAPAAVGDIPTAAENATAVWDEVL